MRKVETILIRRYAQAFFNVYKKQFSIQDCAVIQKAIAYLSHNKTWAIFFDFPPLSDEKQRLMLDRLVDYLDLSKPFFMLGMLLANHKRITILPEVLAAIIDLIMKAHNTIALTISSYPRLNEQQTKAIIDFLHKKTGNHILPTYTLDPSLIAGIRAQGTTLLWEYSLHQKLREAQNRALQRNNQ